MTAAAPHPTLFDLEPAVDPPAPIERRHGHLIRVHHTPAGTVVHCTCGDRSPVSRDYDVTTEWTYRHLGIAYDTSIDRAVRA